MKLHGHAAAGWSTHGDWWVGFEGIGTVYERHVTGDESEGLLLEVSGIPVDRGDCVGALPTMDGREMPMMPRRAIAYRWPAVKTPRSSVIVDRPSSLRTVLVQIEREQYKLYS